MAVIEVGENRDKRSGTQEQNWNRTYTRTFTVVTDDPYTGAQTVLAAVPATLGQAYRIVNGSGVLVEFDKGSFVQRLSANCTAKDGCQWEVAAEYGPFDASEKPQNPLDWPIQVSWGWVKFEKTVEEDVNGDPIQNSAEDFFDPPLTIDDSRPVLRIVRNEASFDPSIAYDFKDAISSDSFFGQDPGKWKCAAPVGELVFNRDCGTSDGYYYEVTYEFEFNPDGWKAKLLDQGLRQLVSSVKSAITEKGIPITEPVPLDGNGAALASGGTPEFLEFDVYQKRAFADLNLDPNGAPGQGS